MTCNHGYIEQIMKADDGYCTICMAAEIERLRADINALTTAANAEATEVERLREKLAIIHDIAQEGVEHDWQAWDNVRTTAASALNETETEQPQKLPPETGS